VWLIPRLSVSNLSVLIWNWDDITVIRARFAVFRCDLIRFNDIYSILELKSAKIYGSTLNFLIFAWWKVTIIHWVYATKKPWNNSTKTWTLQMNHPQCPRISFWYLFWRHGSAQSTEESYYLMLWHFLYTLYTNVYWISLNEVLSQVGIWQDVDMEFSSSVREITLPPKFTPLLGINIYNLHDGSLSFSSKSPGKKQSYIWTELNLLLISKMDMLNSCNVASLVNAQQKSGSPPPPVVPADFHVELAWNTLIHHF
jgi:hypothetical protein